MLNDARGGVKKHLAQRDGVLLGTAGCRGAWCAASATGSRVGRQSPDSTKGSRSSPLNTVACFIVISGSGVAVLVVRLFSWAVAFESAPIVGANSKRISLVADFALIFDPTSAGPACCSFYCSRPGRGANPVASPLQKNQLAAPPPSCRYFAGAVTSCSCYGSCLLLLLCHLESICCASL